MLGRAVGLGVVLMLLMPYTAEAHSPSSFDARLWRQDNKCMGGKAQINGNLQTEAIVYAYKDQQVGGQTWQCYASWVPGINKLGVKTILQKKRDGNWTFCWDRPWKLDEKGSYVVIQQVDFKNYICGQGDYRTKTSVRVHYDGSWNYRAIYSPAHCHVRGGCD